MRWIWHVRGALEVSAEEVGLDLLDVLREELGLLSSLALAGGRFVPRDFLIPLLNLVVLGALWRERQNEVLLAPGRRI